jgi:alkanesulfonate monooxygenase SsuD/methylene tetrahydromethanopterin reductase-like flavin-dependent oxidoreductase (luciferase family)
VPAPQPRIPVVVGGRGDAAAHRAGRYGDGWLGIYVSPSRFAAMVHLVRSQTHACGRPDPEWFGLNVWCGFGRTEAAATQQLADRVESLYRLPFSSFARYCPTGTSTRTRRPFGSGCRPGGRGGRRARPCPRPITTEHRTEVGRRHVYSGRRRRRPTSRMARSRVDRHAPHPRACCCPWGR